MRARHAGADARRGFVLKLRAEQASAETCVPRCVCCNCVPKRCGCVLRAERAEWRAPICGREGPKVCWAPSGRSPVGFLEP
eukprot:2880196-Alexandrium_andersonii.AAC.1